MIDEKRNPESPALYRDIQTIIKLFEKTREENALIKQELQRVYLKVSPQEELELVNIKQAKQICGRSDATIRKHCDVIELGFNASQLFNKKDVLKLKR